MRRLIPALFLSALMLGCEVIDYKQKIENRMHQEIASTVAHFEQTEVKRTIIADTRDKIEAKLDRTKADAMAEYDERAPALYDKGVAAMKDPGLLGLIAGGFGVVLKLALGAGVI